MQAFSIIAVRLMAAFYFLTFIIQLPLFFSVYGSEDNPFSATALILGVFAGLIIAILLWIFSKPVGLLIADHLPPVGERQKIDMNQIVHGGTFLIGFWILVDSTISLLQTIPQLFSYSKTRSSLLAAFPDVVYLDRLWPYLAAMAVGFLIMRYSKKISQVFNKEAQVEKKS